MHRFEYERVYVMLHSLYSLFFETGRVSQVCLRPDFDSSIFYFLSSLGPQIRHDLTHERIALSIGLEFQTIRTPPRGMSFAGIEAGVNSEQRRVNFEGLDEKATPCDRI